VLTLFYKEFNFFFFLIKCRFRKTVQKIKIVDIKALSTRVVHCSVKSSPYCLFLSDSHDSLIASYNENMTEIYNILHNLPLRGYISQWFFDYVSNVSKKPIKSSHDIRQIASVNNVSDCLQCTYQFRSDDFSKLSLKISDARLILLHHAFKAIYSFLQEVGYKKTDSTSTEVEMTNTDLKKKFNLTVQMVRTCIVLLSSNHIESPLLVMRGNFKLQQNSIEDVDPLASSLSDATKYCSVEDYTMDVSDVELFVTNLKTLSALEYAQKEYIFRQHETLTGENQTETNESSVYDCNLVSLSSMLQLPIDFLLEETSPTKPINAFVNGYSLHTDQSEETPQVKATCQAHTFNDFIRVLCPKVNASINVTVHYQPDALSIRNGVHVVVEVQPVVITLSYSDINCLQRCILFLRNQDLINTPSSPTTGEDCLEPQKKITLGNKFPEFKKFSMDLVQVVLTLSDDLEGYTSVPVLQFCTYNGTLTTSLNESSLLNKQQLDGTIAVTVNFFNPRAVVYEPVIENLLLNMHYEKTFLKATTDHKKEKNLDQEKWKITLFGFKKHILCINLPQSFLMSCKKHLSCWKKMQSTYSLDNGETKIVRYRFAPYIIENQCGVPLMLLPSKLLNKEANQKILHEKFSYLYEWNQVLQPGHICRLSQVGVLADPFSEKTLGKVSKLSIVVSYYGRKSSISLIVQFFSVWHEMSLYVSKSCTT
jgi:hypothetical protein